MTHHRSMTRAGAAVLGLAAACVLGLSAAPAAVAAPPKTDVTPSLTCYWANPDGSYTVSLGYTTAGTATQVIAVGPDNTVTPAPADRGQPTTFLPGAHDNVWIADVTAAQVAAGTTWRVTGHTVNVDGRTSECASKPVPTSGSTGGLVVTGAFVLAAGVALTARRRRNRPLTSDV
jgi:MYXO-CTERM domain-containing protein